MKHVPNRVFKSTMTGAGVDKGTATKLFYGPKSLKLWSVNDLDAQRM